MNEKVENIVLQEIELPTAEGASLAPQLDINLIGHLDVNVKVTIGSAQMSVEKLFSLKQGEVIKLNEKLNSNVVIEIDDKPVAQGILVAVDDHFGVEITEVYKISHEL